MAPVDATLEAVVKRDRLVVVTALTAVFALSWAYLLAGAGMGMSTFEMTRVSQLGLPRGMSEGDMAGMAVMTPAVWMPGYAVLMLFMWWVMMIAMMLPSAAPTVLLFAALNRKLKEDGNPFVPTSLFASAYLAAWAGFSIVAVALQWGLESAALLSPILISASAVLGGMLLLAAGIYQLSPLKRTCLKHCRSPLQFILAHWESGASGAFRMGIVHGVYCVGCCWVLMGLLFFGGIMNLYWIIGLAIFVLLEKMIPTGHRLGDLAGMVLIVWGTAVLAGTNPLRFLGMA